MKFTLFWLRKFKAIFFEAESIFSVNLQFSVSTTITSNIQQLSGKRYVQDGGLTAISLRQELALSEGYSITKYQVGGKFVISCREENEITFNILLFKYKQNSYFNLKIKILIYQNDFLNSDIKITFVFSLRLFLLITDFVIFP